MKKYYCILVALAASSFLSTTTHASVVAYDGFENSNAGDLNLQTGGAGWTSAWTATTNIETVVSPGGGLSANGIDGGQAHLRFSGPASSTSVATRSFASQLSSAGDLFVSFLINFSAGSMGNNDFLALILDGAGPSEPNVGIKINQGTGAGPEDYFVRLSGSAGSFGSPIAVVGTTVQLVARLYNSGGTGFNNIDLYVNPVGQNAAPQATYSLGAGKTSINQIRVRVDNLDGPPARDIIDVDQIVIATELSDVVTPEPISLVIWGTASALGLIALKRRK